MALFALKALLSRLSSMLHHRFRKNILFWSSDCLRHDHLLLGWWLLALRTDMVVFKLLDYDLLAIETRYLTEFISIQFLLLIRWLDYRKCWWLKLRLLHGLSTVYCVKELTSFNVFRNDWRLALRCKELIWMR